ncbi:hypothetical protein HD_0421 [[Haemophilus] ducreyi 35000HP]|uniref:Uncharacterized protein n=1 Tax=Haemophilus ducreyi (strain 35000HP / ATCC 700724) TaxID=233412 RepID=Q7VNR6_HAEDU|nr:hypothetical protein HD_0421 [[Haemophilus] ducreyi 35000HP]
MTEGVGIFVFLWKAGIFRPPILKKHVGYCSFKISVV